ncbi:MAG: hypothetical protein KGY66_06025 [Candidatus Thermoplasmatota archaeon]|nr:hypothetical protein [Candidatus Thermoplasmatota archaeon]MBS3790457.1 hypothetical protein [Candidatus Thermoplasmatota archaeon]
MSDDNSTSTQLIGLGIPIGALMGVLASFVSDVEISHAFSFGVAGGIITAALIATVIRKKRIQTSILNLTSLGVGFGTLVGIAIGLLLIWTLGGDYITGFSVGAGAGLLGGALLGIFSFFLL